MVGVKEGELRLRAEGKKGSTKGMRKFHNLELMAVLQVCQSYLCIASLPGFTIYSHSEIA